MKYLILSLALLCSIQAFAQDDDFPVMIDTSKLSVASSQLMFRQDSGTRYDTSVKLSNVSPADALRIKKLVENGLKIVKQSARKMRVIATNDQILSLMALDSVTEVVVNQVETQN